MNRRERLTAAKHAKKIADRLAATALDYTSAGALTPVRDARAVAALARGFERMLRERGEPQVLELTPDAACAFPRVGCQPFEGARAWLAVGLDTSGCATYSVRWLKFDGPDRQIERVAVEAAMLAALQRQLAMPGFPAAGRA